MNLRIVCIVLSCSFILCGCAGETQKATVQTQAEITVPASPVKISAEEAKAFFDGNVPCFLLDVRTPEEYESCHIPGAVLIPDTELVSKVEELPADKESPIFVYCRSGRRSAASAEILTELGYRDVRDFGGILDWPFATEGTDCTPSTAPAETADADHEHLWREYDCNYQQCTVCGAQRRYGQ